MYFKPLLEVIKLAKQVGARVVINAPRSSVVSINSYFKDHLSDFTLLDYEDSISDISPKILRFLVPLYVDSDFYFYKDSDSLVIDKELVIMKHWMSSINPVCMIIRDHPQHVSPILAGMFALSRSQALSVASNAKTYFKNSKNVGNEYSYDQDWLMDRVYPKIRKSAIVYSSYFFYVGETVHRIGRSSYGDLHIGAQSINSKYSENKFDFYKSVYGDKLLCLPYSSLINRALPRLLYGRVRPTLLLAFIFSSVYRLINLLTRGNRNISHL